MLNSNWLLSSSEFLAWLFQYFLLLRRSRLFLFLFLAFTLHPLCFSCPSPPPALGPGPQVKTWRGTMVLPPGPTTCPLDCTRSCAEERRVPKSVPPPERCAACFNALLTLSHSLLHIYCMCGGASIVGLLIKTGCIQLGQGWMDMTGHCFLSVSREKGIED